MTSDRLRCECCRSEIRLVATDSERKEYSGTPVTELSFSQACDCYVHGQDQPYPKYWPVESVKSND